jgi:hypothetical protein
MGFLKKRSDKPHADGPKEWARMAAEKDAEVKRQRALEAAGETAVESSAGPEIDEPTVLTEVAPAENVEQGPVVVADELSIEALKHIGLQGNKAKWVRIHDLILVGPQNYTTADGGRMRVEHEELAEKFAKLSPEAKALLETAQAAVAQGGRLLEAVGTANKLGMEDAGFIEIQDPGITSIKMGGKSGSWGMAMPSGRRQTFEIAQQALGPNVQIIDEFVTS